MELGVERSQRSVGLIERADIAIEREFSACGEIGADADRKFRRHGNVRSGDVHVIVRAVLLRIRGADNDAAILKLELFNGEGRGRAWRIRRLCGRV